MQPHDALGGEQVVKLAGLLEPAEQPLPGLEGAGSDEGVVPDAQGCRGLDR